MPPLPPGAGFRARATWSSCTARAARSPVRRAAAARARAGLAALVPIAHGRHGGPARPDARGPVGAAP
eukprot:3503951-Alexandrium_andersonii.AAC.1